MCDFGIAKFKNKTFLTTVNSQAGTPAYMAPEVSAPAHTHARMHARTRTHAHMCTHAHACALCIKCQAMN